MKSPSVVSATLFLFALIPSLCTARGRHLIDAKSSSRDIQQVAVGPVQTTTGTEERPEFAVASVRPSTQDANRKGYDFLNPYSTLQPKGGIFSVHSQLLGLIIFAYGIRDASQYSPLVQQLPKWAQSDWFDIEARADGNTNRDQVRLMTQSLLIKRFGLVVHTEVRQGKVLALELSGHGSSLHPHEGRPPCVDPTEKKIDSPEGTPQVVYCGIDVLRVQGRLHVAMVDVSMEQIASILGGLAGTLGARETLPILDRTGLRGKYDATLDFVPDKDGPADAASDTPGETFTKALESQLGLKLTKQTGPHTAIVIDHVERPSAN